MNIYSNPLDRVKNTNVIPIYKPHGIRIKKYTKNKIESDYLTPRQKVKLPSINHNSELINDLESMRVSTNNEYELLDPEIEKDYNDSRTANQLFERNSSSPTSIKKFCTLDKIQKFLNYQNN